MNPLQAHAVELHGCDGPRVVLGHGIGGHPDDWSALIEAFSGRCQLLTYAIAGSRAADPALFSPTRHSRIEGFADDLALICAELRWRGAIYIGHSLSATAGLLAQIADPGLFSQLILLNGSVRYLDDPVTDYHGGFQLDQVEAMLEAISGDFEAWASGFGPLVMGNPERPEFGSEFVRSLQSLDPQVVAVMFRAAFTGDYRALLPRLRVPTLLLQSLADPAVPLDAARWLASAIAGARLQLLDCTGHFPHLVAPELLIAALEGELARATPRPEAVIQR